MMWRTKAAWVVGFAGQVARRDVRGRHTHEADRGQPEDECGEHGDDEIISDHMHEMPGLFDSFTHGIYHFGGER